MSMPKGLKFVPYHLERGNGIDTHPLALEIESKVLRGEAVAEVSNRLQKKGFEPDLIVGHPGWGDMLFLDAIWPTVPQVHYAEFFHGVPGTDNDFPDMYAGTLDWRERARTRMKNSGHLLNLNQMRCGVSPTYFQRSLLPDWAQARTTVIHDGIDTDWLCPDPSASLTLPDSRTLHAGDKVVTFVNRTFEPYRGVHVFLEALCHLQRLQPEVEAILVGRDTPKVSYGAHREDGKGWLQFLREELGGRIDWRRIHVTGPVSHGVLRQIYRISAAHVYLTYPFVLSWSLMEAMSCGCLVVGSDTAPVREVVSNGDTGLLVPFHQPEKIAATLDLALSKPAAMHHIRAQARNRILSDYRIQMCQQRWLMLLDGTVSS
jgi:glycosyltransferase involved in cell wall biosynthesis